MAKPIFDFRHLNAEERMQLAEELWDSLSELPEPLPLTAAQAEELDRRVEEYRRDGDPARTSTWIGGSSTWNLLSRPYSVQLSAPPPALQVVRSLPGGKVNLSRRNGPAPGKTF